ncbi:hypothetical protein Purlil1_13292 [Purpureocillium lilacinum]|uniref:Myb-like domain-containing protein n=1 Tax=Purpureocillium lilacinum TaxID=33203 RepID=A0ABR0BEP1_PURLI|nr:hypothetical protein Purlil1_13292 [Purpureocillium lilacinum]
MPQILVASMRVLEEDFIARLRGAGTVRYSTLFRTDPFTWRKVVPAQAIVAHLSITCGRLRGNWFTQPTYGLSPPSTNIIRGSNGEPRSHDQVRIFIHASRLSEVSTVAAADCISWGGKPPQSTTRKAGVALVFVLCLFCWVYEASMLSLVPLKPALFKQPESSHGLGRFISYSLWLALRVSANLNMAAVTLDTQVFWAPPAARCAKLGEHMKRTQAESLGPSSPRRLSDTTSTSRDLSPDTTSSSNHSSIVCLQALGESTESSSGAVSKLASDTEGPLSVVTPSSPAYSLPKEEVPEGPVSVSSSGAHHMDIAAAQRSMSHEINLISESGPQSLDRSAEKDRESDGYGDHCAEVESRYPIDPLLEPQDLVSAHSIDRSISTHDDFETTMQSQHHQTGNASDSCTGHSRDSIDDVNETSEQAQRQHGGSEPAAATSRRSGGSTAAFPAIETTPLERRIVPRRLPCPTAADGTPDGENISAIDARFEEWPLQNAILKRVIVAGMATFQLQFEWPVPTVHSQRDAVARYTTRPSTRRHGSQQKPAKRTKFAPEEDDLLIKLKAEGMLTWAEIHQQFTATFPGRSRGSLQVHYSTVLKERSSSCYS